jgi:hypothetical protein
MKPLAAPVVGGMISSLLHILIVTPVVFAWLRERALFGRGEPVPAVLAKTGESAEPLLHTASIR